MQSIKQQLTEDRLMRDAARRVVETDIEFIKRDLEHQGIGERVKLRAEDGAAEAAEFAEANSAKVGTGIALVTAGLFAWIFRDWIVEAIDSWLGPDEEEDGERGERFPGEAELDRLASRLRDKAKDITGDIR